MLEQEDDESERPPEVEGRDESDEERVVDMVGASLGFRLWWKCGRCMLASVSGWRSGGWWAAEARRLRWLRKLWRMRVDEWCSCWGEQNIVCCYRARAGGGGLCGPAGDKVVVVRAWKSLCWMLRRRAKRRHQQGSGPERELGR